MHFHSIKTKLVLTVGLSLLVILVGNDINHDDRSILIIEDDADFAKTLLELTRSKDFKGLIACDGNTGLTMAEKYLPDAILLDLGLPDIDGMAVISRLKENLAIRHIPIHIISGRESGNDTRKIGAMGFLQKPISVEGLEQAFSRIEHLISDAVKHLLVVEDDAATCKSIMELIEDDDVTITTVSTGREAIEVLDNKQTDCVVLDLTLPDMPGLEILEKIKKDKYLSQIPVIVCTGKDLSDQETLLLDEYADKTIIKGDRYAELLLDETALFLHRVEKDMPEDKRRIIQMVHDKDAIFKSRTALIVDDDMRNVFALSNMLEDKGLSIIAAGNGVEALKQLQANGNIDVVLMDIMMPEMDGYEAMRKIRSQSQHENLPIIALTAKAMKGDRAKCIEAGASDYLSKPIDEERLLSMLRVWLYK